jgi:insulysin
MVENSRTVLNLAPISLADIEEVNLVSLKQGECSAYWIPLADDANDNSCALSYYEVGLLQDDTKKKLTAKIIMQFLNEPFFDDLRTKQQLGYVVFSRDS